MTYKEGDMDLVRNRNIRRDGLFRAIQRIDTPRRHKVCLEAVFIRQDEAWRFLVGKFSLSDSEHFNSEVKYKEFYF
ncbi:MAG: hypothetical protein KKC55_16110, partial [Gammaproteobacteria bacterium]|nr:hypothetical protein [Gammaproteobacteria bacterium]